MAKNSRFSLKYFIINKLSRLNWFWNPTLISFTYYLWTVINFHRLKTLNISIRIARHLQIEQIWIYSLPSTFHSTERGQLEIYRRFTMHHEQQVKYSEQINWNWKEDWFFGLCSKRNLLWLFFSLIGINWMLQVVDVHRNWTKSAWSWINYCSCKSFVSE